MRRKISARGTKGRSIKSIVFISKNTCRGLWALFYSPIVYITVTTIREGLRSVERLGITLSQKLANFVTADHFPRRLKTTTRPQVRQLKCLKPTSPKNDKIKSCLVKCLKNKLNSINSSRTRGFLSARYDSWRTKKQAQMFIFTRKMEISKTHPALENKNGFSSQL